MPAGCRVSDKHGVLLDVEGSPNVFFNGLPVHRLGDKHTIPAIVMIEASKTVFANGKGICRIGDKNSINMPETTGSLNVFVGD